MSVATKNCPHRVDGWCLKCVEELQREHDTSVNKISSDYAEERDRLLRIIDDERKKYREIGYEIHRRINCQQCGDGLLGCVRNLVTDYISAYPQRASNIDNEKEEE